MEMKKPRPDIPAMTFDEVSMEHSKSFVKALQELKNLRPQLYSAAEYCEKSYLHSEQKEMVLNNLKDYAVRAFVNAIDHLGTVTCKLTDLLEQQTLDVSTMELNVSCLNQQIITCQIYVDKEGLRQHQLLAIIPRHHKHYILPNSVNKKVHFSPHTQTDARTRLYSSGTPVSKTLSWHIASETKSAVKGTPCASISSEDSKNFGQTSGVFHLLDAGESKRPKSSAVHVQVPSGRPASSAIKQTLGVTWRDFQEGNKLSTGFRSFDNPTRREIVRPPVRSKSMLSAFFVKQRHQN